MNGNINYKCGKFSIATFDYPRVTPSSYCIYTTFHTHFFLGFQVFFFGGFALNRHGEFFKAFSLFFLHVSLPRQELGGGPATSRRGRSQPGFTQLLPGDAAERREWGVVVRERDSLGGKGNMSGYGMKTYQQLWDLYTLW